MTEQEKAMAYNQELKAVLQLIFDELNYGQAKKLAENERVRPWVVKYGIEVRKE